MKKCVRKSNSLCILSIWEDTMIPLSAYKYASKSRIDRPSPSVPASVTSTTITQWRMMASKTMLKSVGYRGSPWVTPWYPLKVGAY